MSTEHHPSPLGASAPVAARGCCCCLRTARWTSPTVYVPTSPSAQHAARYRLLFWANILILIPVGFGTMLKPSLTDQGAFVESAGWRMLAGSLWIGILTCSALGVVWPDRFLCILLFQVIYKSVWLLGYALPRLLDGRRAEVPAGIGGSFLVIVLVWPCVIPWSQLFGSVEQLGLKEDSGEKDGGEEGEEGDKGEGDEEEGEEEMRESSVGSEQGEDNLDYPSHLLSKIPPTAEANS
jgi:hypothetical protein